MSQQDTPETPAEQPRKFGEGSLQAAFRQGFKEIGQALRALPDSLPVIEEPGQINNPTTYGVSKQAGYVQPAASVVDRHLEAAREAPELTTPEQEISK